MNSNFFNKAIAENKLEIDGIFAYSNFENCKDIQAKGIKIHVSATSVNYQDIINTFFDFIKSKHVHYKIISSYKDLIDINAGVYGYSQIGKIITIYPHKNEVLIYLELLSRMYKEFCSVDIPTDFSYKNSSVIYYRYGNILNKIESEYERSKKARHSQLKGIPDFNIKKHDVIPKKYVFIETITKKAKGGVYLALDLENKQKAIIKESTFLGDLDSAGTDSIDRIINEYEVLKKLSKYSFLPKILDIFYVRKNLFIVESYFQCITMHEYAIDRKVTVAEKIKYYNLLLCEVEKLHKRNIVHRDITLTNILVDFKSEKVYIIDFEFAVDLHKEEMLFQKYIGGTQGYVNNRYKSINFSVDFYSLATCLYYLIQSDEYLEYYNSYQDNIKDKTFEKFRKNNDTLLRQSLFKNAFQNKITSFELYKKQYNCFKEMYFA
jgi:tRNA A-37 threonylcarbamoyl transferase component Bud32